MPEGSKGLCLLVRWQCLILLLGQARGFLGGQAEEPVVPRLAARVRALQPGRGQVFRPAAEQPAEPR